MHRKFIPISSYTFGQKKHFSLTDAGVSNSGVIRFVRPSQGDLGPVFPAQVSRKKDGHFSVTRVEDLIETDLGPFLDLGPDEWVKGVVKSVSSFEGAFVTVFVDKASADGFLHISEISTSFVSSVRDVLSEGQEVRVRMLSVDVDSGRIILSMKGDRSAVPVKEINHQRRVASRMAGMADIPSDQWLQGKVVRMMNFGAFVAVNPDSPSSFLEEGAVEGLLHRSQMTAPWVFDKNLEKMGGFRIPLLGAMNQNESTNMIIEELTKTLVLNLFHYCFRCLCL